MVKFLATLLAGLVSLSAFGATFQSTQSGLFTDAATWTNGAAPSANSDAWIIATNHTVWYDTDNSAAANGWAASIISGTLNITNACYLKMGGSVTGTGYSLIGTSNNPIPYTADNRPSVVIEHTWSQWTLTRAAAAAWFGDTNGFVGYITNSTVVAGDNTNLWFAANVSNVASNDVVVIDNHGVRGSGEKYFVVYSVETNRITLFNAIIAGAAVVTNTWYQTTMSTGLINNARTNGTMVAKLSRPIVYMQKTRLGGQNGVRGYTNIFHGMCVSVIAAPFTGGSSYTGNHMESCTASGGGGSDATLTHYGTLINCLGGGVFSLCYGGSTLDSCVTVGGTYMIQPSATAGTLTNCVGRNHTVFMDTVSYQILHGCDARNMTYGITANGTSNILVSCVGANSANTGISYTSIGGRYISCISSNSSYGFSYNEKGATLISCRSEGTPFLFTGNGNYAIGCVGVDNQYGFAYNCNDVTLVNCTVTNGGTGGFANTCIGVNIINCNSYSQAAPVRSYQSYGLKLQDTNGLPYSSMVTSWTSQRPYYEVVPVSGTNWLSACGNTYLTNIAAPFSSQVFAHVPVNAGPVILWKEISVKPFSARDIGVYTFGTNNIGWAYSVLESGAFTHSPTPITYSTSGWQFTSVSLTNGYPTDKTYRLWIQSTSTNGNHIGYSWVNVPTDYTTKYQ